jgi:hypothetical protein
VTLLLLPDDRAAHRVWPVPDEEPVKFDKPLTCYADWITPDLMRATEEG